MFLIAGSAIAQYGDPGLPGGDPDVPLDGGVTLMLLAGACYGVKKIRDAKR
ncbi:PID-CTERM protein-sorting domain-containing protein [Pedobacter sp. PWIIR3]